MKLHSLLLGACGVLALSSMASAEELKGLYIGGAAGITQAPNTTATTNAGDSARLTFKGGPAFLLEAGYRFGNGWRAGIEAGWTENPIDNFNTGGAGTNPRGNGHVRNLTEMAAVYYDFGVGKFRPYLGAGVGLGTVDIDGGNSSTGLNINKSDTNIAWQARAGVTVKLTDNLEADAGYRYLDSGRADFGVQATRAHFKYKTHSVLIGLRYTFGKAAEPPKPAPAPASAPAAAAPPPPPPPAISRNFMVFFDFDKSDITADARTVLQNVARDAKAGSVPRVQIVGHADRSGPTDYNQKLSERRAKAVADELARLGVPAGGISTSGKGETDPMVPTADGVREPSNRRAVIVFP